MSSDCLFCKLAREGDHVRKADGFVAVRDIAPKAPDPPPRPAGAPSRELPRGRRARPRGGEALLRFVADTAREVGLEDYRVVVNVGPGAGQTVFHLHWHILGGAPLGGDGVSLIAQIEGDVKEAMRAREQERVDTLRLVLASLRSAEKELQRPLSDQEELQVLQRERKRRAEAAEAFREGGRDERAEQEERELEVIESFMPDPVSEEELERIVDDAIAETGATSMRDLGRVMADVMPQVSGRRRRLRGEPARAREARLGSGRSLRDDERERQPRPRAGQPVPRRGAEPASERVHARQSDPAWSETEHGRRRCPFASPSACRARPGRRSPDGLRVWARLNRPPGRGARAHVPGLPGPLLERRLGRDGAWHYLEFGVFYGTSLLRMQQASADAGLARIRLFGSTLRGAPRERRRRRGRGLVRRRVPRLRSGSAAPPDLSRRRLESNHPRSRLVRRHPDARHGRAPWAPKGERDPWSTATCTRRRSRAFASQSR